ncbi:pimeloyl-ACP methyl ester carboxylesterase [Mycobacterium sp. OAE908]
MSLRTTPGSPQRWVHVIDAGHFALDEAPDLVADLTGAFLVAIRP